MGFEITGKLIEKYDIQKVTETFRKREFVLETVEEGSSRSFSESIKFQLTQDRVDLLDPFNPQETIKVHFNIKGRKWEKEGRVSYFTNLEAWRLEAVGNSNPSPAPAESAPKDAFSTNGDFEDDLPF